MDCCLFCFNVQLISVNKNNIQSVILFSSHPSYQDDYYVTSDQMYVPLRWIAPEMVDEVHGNLLVADQTQQSNMW